MSVLQKTLVSLLIVSYGVSCSTPSDSEQLPPVQVKTLAGSSTQVVVSDTVNPLTILDGQGKMVRQFPAEPGANVVFFSDHQRVLVQDATGKPRVYTLAMGPENGISLADQGSFFSAMGTYKDQYFVGLSPDGTVTSWSLKGDVNQTISFAGLLQTSETPKGGFFAKGGSMVLVDGGNLLIVDPLTGDIFDRKDAVSADKITTLAIEGNTLAVGDSQGFVKTWSWDSNQNKLTAEAVVAHLGSPIALVDVEEGGARLLLLSKEGSGQVVRLMPATPCDVVLSQASTGAPLHGRLTKSLLWTIDAQGQVAKWDSAAGCGAVSAVAVYGGPATIGKRSDSTAIIAPDEKAVLTVASDTGTQLWSIDAAKNILVDKNSLSKASFSQKGNRFSIVNSFLLFGTVLDLFNYPVVGNAPVLIGSAKMDGTFAEQAFSPDDNVIALADGDGVVTLYSTTPAAMDKLPVRSFLVHENAGFYIYLAFSSDSSLLATGGKDGSVKLWDATKTDGKQISTPNATFQTGDTVLSVAFSADGKYILTASEGNKAQLWDAAATGDVSTALATFTHKTRTAGAYFSVDGNYIITVGDDSIKMWPIESRDGSAMPVAVFSACAREVALSPGGNYMATACQVLLDSQGNGSPDPRVYVWDLRARGNVTKPLVELKTKNKSPGKLQFSSTGQFILVNGADANLGELWSIGVPLLGVYKIPSAQNP